jgi:hypothetical protein
MAYLRDLDTDGVSGEAGRPTGFACEPPALWRSLA